MGRGIGTVQPHPEWRVIVVALRDLPYGTFLTHAELAVVSGVPAQTRRYYDQVGRARIALLAEAQRYLESEAPQGYRLVEGQEFHRCGRRQVKLAGRRLRRGAAIHANAPQHLLTDAENAANADALAKVGALLTQLRRVQRDTDLVTRPPTPDTPKLLKPVQ